MSNVVDHLLALFNQHLTLYIIIPLVFLFGIYLTIRLRAIQIMKIKVGIRHLFLKEEKEKGSISNFQAISTVLAGNLGTGNISGMAVALTFGGPGALFWMWIMGFLGAILKYSGCFLGFQYRIRNEENEYVGGPMYYLSKGVKSKLLAIFFSIFCIFTAITAGNLVQVNSVVLPLTAMGVSPWILGLVMTVIIAVVILGGTLRFARFAEVVVPFMAVIYILAALYIIGIYYDRIGFAFAQIFIGAFKPVSVGSGLLGYGFLMAISNGFQRGIFATDAGVGIAPILQSGAREKKPILEGFVAMTAPLFVLIICTLTILVLLVTKANTDSGLESTNMCAWAFTQGLGSVLGKYITIISLFFFAITTVLAWSTAANKAVEYLFGLKAEKWFSYLFILIVPIGAFIDIRMLWSVADLCMGLMLLSNLVGLLILSKSVIHTTLKSYNAH